MNIKKINKTNEMDDLSKCQKVINILLKVLNDIIEACPDDYEQS